MKVLLLNGSPRRESNTLLALQQIADTLGKEGIESEILSVGVQPVRSCIVCNTCKRKADNRCVFDESSRSFSGRSIRRAHTSMANP